MCGWGDIVGGAVIPNYIVSVIENARYINTIIIIIILIMMISRSRRIGSELTIF